MSCPDRNGGLFLTNVMMLILAEIVNSCRTLILPVSMDNTQAAGSSKTSVNLCQTARCHIPGNSIHFRENIKTHKFVCVQHLLRNGLTISFGLNPAIESQLWRGGVEWSERTSAGTRVCSSGTWVYNLFMVMSHTRYCRLGRGPHVEN